MATEDGKLNDVVESTGVSENSKWIIAEAWLNYVLV